MECQSHQGLQEVKYRTRCFAAHPCVSKQRVEAASGYRQALQESLLRPRRRPPSFVSYWLRRSSWV